jgi:hypothetical protein
MRKNILSLCGALLLWPGLSSARVLKVASASASSTEADSGAIKYSARNLGDGKQGTVWAEGEEGSGLGAWVELTLASEALISEIRIWNGNWYTKDSWETCNRVRELEAIFSDGTRETFTLADRQEVETIKLKSPKKTSSVKLKPKSVYGGRGCNQTGFSEVQLIDSTPEPYVQTVSYESSSHHPPSGDGHYRPSNLGDGILDTMWCENDAGSGSGEWVELSLGKATSVSRLSLVNGNAFSFSEFMGFNRAKTIELQFSDGSTVSLTPKPTPSAQELSFPARTTSSVRIKITDAMSGKNGHEILCLSEARLQP